MDISVTTCFEFTIYVISAGIGPHKAGPCDNVSCRGAPVARGNSTLLGTWPFACVPFLNLSAYDWPGVSTQGQADIPSALDGRHIHEL